MRLPVPPENGIGPLIQQWRMPFFSSIVVMVAVVIFSSVATTFGRKAQREPPGWQVIGCATIGERPD